MDLARPCPYESPLEEVQDRCLGEWRYIGTPIGLPPAIKQDLGDVGLYVYEVRDIDETTAGWRWSLESVHGDGAAISPETYRTPSDAATDAQKFAQAVYAGWQAVRRLHP